MLHYFAEDIVAEGVDLMQEVSSAIETLLLILCTQESDGNMHALRVRQAPSPIYRGDAGFSGF